MRPFSFSGAWESPEACPTSHPLLDTGTTLRDWQFFLFDNLSGFPKVEQMLTGSTTD